ncbi:MAG: hypothetical protein KDF65_15765 [Anaerolineae bacterium]|nr:hypothetical protein [Anaerolineae bacterium]
MLLKAKEKKVVVEVLNARIDIPWVPEEIEGQVIEHAINLVEKALEDVLPQPFINLMRDGSSGIDPEKARVFGERVIAAINQKVNLPYFNEEQEAAFLRMMVDPVVEAMIDGQTIKDVLAKAKANVGERLEASDPS